MIKYSIKLLTGILGFFIIWAICLAVCPIFLIIIGAKYANDFLAAKKDKKQLAPHKNILYIPATKDNNIHSAN